VKRVKLRTGGTRMARRLRLTNRFSIIFMTDSKFVTSYGKFCAALRPALW
jgi:hypothetical protein